MILRTRSFALAFLALAMANESAAEVSFSTARADEIERLLRDHFTESDAAMVIGLVDANGRRIYSAGKLDNGTDREVDGDTVFEIGSVTKVFTSLLLLEMARRGEVSVDDPVDRYLPGDVSAPAFGENEITLLHLAAQDSGLPWFPDNLAVENHLGLGAAWRKAQKLACEAYTFDDLYTFLSAHRLTEEPGKRFQYSNVGMGLLGHALGRKAGEGYEAALVARICEPLGMTSTRIALSGEQRRRLAHGHWTDGAVAPSFNPKVFRGAGALRSTANDLLRFLAANLGFEETPLRSVMEKTHRIRHEGSPRFGRTALPWLDERVYQPPGSNLLGHGGGGYGYLAFVGFDTKKRRGVVVLSSQMALSPTGIGWALLQEMPLSSDNIRLLVREIVGLGVALEPGPASGFARIRRVFPESPAGRAGIADGLLLREIDGVSTEGKSLEDCLRMLKGPEGKSVRLRLSRSNDDPGREVKLERGKFLTSTDSPASP